MKNYYLFLYFLYIKELQDSNELTYQSYVGAKNWLSKWEKLYIKYNDK